MPIKSAFTTTIDHVSILDANANFDRSWVPVSFLTRILFACMSTCVCVATLMKSLSNFNALVAWELFHRTWVKRPQAWARRMPWTKLIG